MKRPPRAARRSPRRLAATIHGIGWQRRGSITGQAERWIEIPLEDADDGEWPFPFRASLRLELDPAGLFVTVALMNTGDATMPAGIDHHSHFPHRREGSERVAATAPLDFFVLYSPAAEDFSCMEAVSNRTADWIDLLNRPGADRGEPASVGGTALALVRRCGRGPASYPGCPEHSVAHHGPGPCQVPAKR